MIDRYALKEMKQFWTSEARFKALLDVEKAVAVAQGKLGLIPLKAVEDITKKSSFDIARIEEIEKTTRHDVIAFVSCVAESIGEMGRYVHYGLTSSDVLDTALNLQILKSGLLIQASLKKLKSILLLKSKENRNTLCSGRTHGMHAEPTTFGYKLLGFVSEIKRQEIRLKRALDGISIVKLSGAVGTYSVLSPEVEKMVGESLGLRPEIIATQVVPRDRHAEVMVVLSLLGSTLERLALEVRHLQRTEVGEVEEGFSKGQKGSSAMPHKRNPISSENLTGVSRMLRSYAQGSLENIALWHERDISHSSVERVFFPDAFILCHYALERMCQVIENLIVYGDRMKTNMNLSRGQMFSSHLLILLVEKGWSREKAYEKIQKLSHSLYEGQSLEEVVLIDSDILESLSKEEIKKIFTGETHLKTILSHFDSVFELLSKEEDCK